MFVCMYVPTCVYVNFYEYTYVYTCVCVFISVGMFVCMYILNTIIGFRFCITVMGHGTQHLRFMDL